MKAFEYPGDATRLVKVSAKALDGPPPKTGDALSADIEYQRSITTELDGQRLAPTIEAVVTIDGVVVGYVETRAPGRTLQQLGDAKAITEAQFETALTQWRAQLDALHRDGFVHGDPFVLDNIVVDIARDGTVRARLIDFEPPTRGFDVEKERGEIPAGIKKLRELFGLLGKNSQ
ncbi:MAG: hypothetical protein R3B06_32685 [Kofleriaceae bacterium]